jgi:hypothetical protein
MDIISGKWTGKYIYGENYVEELRGKAVAFQMELFYDGDLVTGTCIDEETKDLFSKPAKITGTFENNTILFFKSYPDVTGLVSASRLIAEEFNAASIEYTGILKKKFFSGRRFFEGTWQINGSFLDKNGVANYYELDGTWIMKKT